MNAHAQVLLGAGYYLHWGVVQISLTNFLIIVGMIVLFVAALLLPFPGGRDQDDVGAPHVKEGHDGND